MKLMWLMATVVFSADKIDGYQPEMRSLLCLALSKIKDPPFPLKTERISSCKSATAAIVNYTRDRKVDQCSLATLNWVISQHPVLQPNFLLLIQFSKTCKSPGHIHNIAKICLLCKRRQTFQRFRGDTVKLILAICQFHKNL